MLPCIVKISRYGGDVVTTGYRVPSACDSSARAPASRFVIAWLGTVKLRLRMEK